MSLVQHVTTPKWVTAKEDVGLLRKDTDYRVIFGISGGSYGGYYVKTPNGEGEIVDKDCFYPQPTREEILPEKELSITDQIEGFEHLYLNPDLDITEGNYWLLRDSLSKEQERFLLAYGLELHPYSRHYHICKTRHYNPLTDFVHGETIFFNDLFI